MKDFLKKPTLYIIIIIILVILLLLKSCGPGGSGLLGGLNTKDNKKPPFTQEVNKKNRIESFSKAELDTLRKLCTQNLNAVGRYGAGTFLVVGDSGRILTSFNGGLNWKLDKFGNTKFFGAVVLNYDTMIAVGSAGRIVRSSNHGTTWDTITSHTSDTIRAVSFPDKVHGVAVGDRGLILKTSDAGLNWDTIPLKPVVPVMPNITSVCFIDANTGWLAGSGGMIRKTTNFGGAWVPESSTTTLNLKGISFNNSSRGTAVGDGGIVLTTKNGGNTWVPAVVSPLKELKAVHRVSNVLAYIAGHGIIMREDNGVLKKLDTISTSRFNAVDAGIYVQDLAVGDDGKSLAITTSACDNCSNNGNNDLMLIPPGPDETNWTVRLRVYNSYRFRRFLRFITPGFEIYHRTVQGWTQSDGRVPIVEPLLVSDGMNQGNIITNPVLLGDNSQIDAITLDMRQNTSGFLYFTLNPTQVNTIGTGTFEFYFGECAPGSSGGCTLEDEQNLLFCHKVTYNLNVDTQTGDNINAP